MRQINPGQAEPSRRQLFQSLLATVASGGILANAQTAAPAPALQVAALGKNLSVLSGAGGNIALLTSPDGLLMVDSGLPNTVAGVMEKAKAAAPKVAVLINTHWHFDHVGANVEIGKTGARLIAHVNVKQRLSAKQHIAAFDRDIDPLPAEGLPKETFTAKGKVSYAGEHVHYTHLPPAHTDGDTVIHFQHANVLHAGDLYFNGRYPFIDYSSCGNIEGMIANAALISKMVDAKTKIIPGHGPISNKEQLAEYHDMLSGVNASISKLIQEGKPLEAIVAAKPFSKWDGKWSNGGENPKQFITFLYQGKTGKKS